MEFRNSIGVPKTNFDVFVLFGLPPIFTPARLAVRAKSYKVPGNQPAWLGMSSRYIIACARSAKAAGESVRFLARSYGVGPNTISNPSAKRLGEA
jgi:hypothetical protein